MEYTVKKKKKNRQSKAQGTEVIVEGVVIVVIASLADKHIFYQFMNIYLYFFAFSQPNIYI